MTRSIVLVYTAAAMAFALGVWRDWVLINHSDAYQQLFAVMYAVYLPSFIAVNVVTLGQGIGHHRGEIIVLILVSALICGLLLWFWKQMPLWIVVLSMPIPGLYLLGAKAARSLLSAGHVFVSRLRDGLVSLLMSMCVLLGLVHSSFLVSVLISTLAYVLLARRLGNETDSGELPASDLAWSHRFATLLYSNAAPCMFYAWALQSNASSEVMMGFDAPVVVRWSVYAFQLASVPAVLITRLPIAAKHIRALRALAWANGLLMCLNFALPLGTSALLAPVVAIGCLYASVALMKATSRSSAA